MDVVAESLCVLLFAHGQLGRCIEKYSLIDSDTFGLTRMGDLCPHILHYFDLFKLCFLISAMGGNLDFGVINSSGILLFLHTCRARLYDSMHSIINLWRFIGIGFLVVDKEL